VNLLLKFYLPGIILFSFNFSLAITNGVPLADEDYPAVVLIEDMESQSVGTGVVVGNGTILTAKHCVASKSPKNIRINGEYLVSEIIAGDNVVSQSSLDLALLKIPTNHFKNILPIAKVKLPPPPIPISIIGYGLAFKSDLPLDYDTTTLKRIGKNVIGDSQNSINDLYLNIEFDHVPYDPVARSGGLPGDSGGPMLWNDLVVGIASKSIFLSSYVNLSGPRAKNFLSNAVSKGWQIQFK
jgi:hypothetical protein